VVLVLAVLMLSCCCCVRLTARESSRGRLCVQVARLMLVAVRRGSKRCGAILGENRTKLKIAITFYQIVNHVEHTYHVQYPEGVHAVLSAFPFSLRAVGRFLLGPLPILHSTCLGLNLPGRLTVGIVAPVALALLPVSVMKLRGHNALHSVHLLLGWSFLVYPTVVSMGFSAIGECDCFENNAPGGDGTERTCFLRADYEEPCFPDSPFAGRRPIVSTLAMVAIVAYGFGVPLIHLGLVMRDHDAIIQERPLIGLSAEISFLHADYTNRFYWWELVESMKKLVLTGFLALYNPGTLEQLLVANVIVFIMLTLQGLISPMKTASDNLLSFLSATMLALFFLGSYACQAASKLEIYLQKYDDASWLIVALLIGAVLVIALVMFGSLVLRLREMRNREAHQVTNAPPLPPLRAQLLTVADSAFYPAANASGSDPAANTAGSEISGVGLYDLQLNEAAVAAMSRAPEEIGMDVHGV